MTRPISLESFNDLVGISHDELDCYELVVEFYKRVFKRQLNILYQIRPSHDQAKSLFEQQKSEFINVTTPKFGDIIVIRHALLPCHIGIYLTKDLFLHTKQSTGSCIERISLWKNRIEGYYRWPEK